MTDRSPHYAGQPGNEEIGVWLRWRQGSNTAEIARALDRPEHEISLVIARLLNTRYLNAPYAERRI